MKTNTLLPVQSYVIVAIVRTYITDKMILDVFQYNHATDKDKKIQKRKIYTRDHNGLLNGIKISATPQRDTVMQ